MQLSMPFRRRSGADDAAGADSVDGAEVARDEDVVSTATKTARSRARTPSKRELGKVTPKRRDGGRRVEPPPKDRREAARRAREKRREMRERQRQQRAEIRQAMMAGKEEYLPARDKGPERSLVRDVVDSRRNLASYFLPSAILVIIGSSAAMPPAIQLGTTLFWASLSVGIVVDSVLLTRRVKKAITKRFPKATRPPRVHYTYAILRSLQIRRLRLPKPKVALGERVAG